jgi:Subtilase family
MGTGALRTVLASAGALLALLALPCASALATAESAVSPLPESDYTARPVCAPPAPGYAGCLALELVPKTAAARTHTHPLGITTNRPIVAAKASEGAFGLRPQDLHSIYALPRPASSTQTIALVDAYNDLTIESDLETYDKEFGLPECTSLNGCFAQVNQKGQNGKTGMLPFPASEKARAEEEALCETGTGEEQEKACKEVEEAEGWSEEISLDIEVSHATCEHCKIVLVEADSASFSDLESAEQAAVGLHATEISNSWGGPQPDETSADDNASSFNHPRIVITAAAGDDGYLDWDAEAGSVKGFADYPAASPHVVAVGGTRLQLPLGPGETWAGETVWNGDGAGGGGCSVRLTSPPWQQSTSGWESVGCGGHRAVADVAADADPYTGMAVYDSGFNCEYEPHVVIHWCPIGGTSLASPLVASVYALAGGANGVEYPAQTLYENETEDPATLHDVVSGSNGECTKPFNEDGLDGGTSGCTVSEEAAQCSGQPICTAGPGYDGPTGVGTPDGITAFKPVSEEVKRKNEEKLREEEKKKEEEERSRTAGSSGSGSGSNGATTGSSSTSAGDVSPATGGSGDSSAGTTIPSAGTPTIEMTAFALTPTALLALNRARPKVSSVRFAFILSAAARVRATLAKLVRVHRHNRWVPVPGALTFSAAKGRNQQHLTSSDGLTSGRYRLTLAPQGGAARTLTFQVA